MISAWRIFSSAVAFSAAFCVGALQAATVTGQVELRDSRESSVRKKKDFSGVAVWLEPSAGKPSPPSPLHARMIQKDKTFSPHILAIPTGSTVDFPNFDPIFHNVFSTYDGQIFDLGLYRPGTSKSVTFTKQGIVRVFCNIHSSMSAIIAVLDTPYFDVSKKDGSFELRDVPWGEYRLRVFHERATQATLDELTRRVTVAGDSLTLASLTISESGFLAIPHLNKFGHPYPASSDDSGVYPAVRK
jgi:plastocyanin